MDDPDGLGLVHGPASHGGWLAHGLAGPWA